MKNKSTILLDLDGVMIKNKPWIPIELESDGFCAFDKGSTERLNHIISETDAHIILTTSHKVKYSVSEWNDIFKRRGINTFVDKLYTDGSRLDEIISWYENKSTNNFIILDDDKSLNALPSYIKCRLVQTDPMIGLTDELAELSIEILK